MKTVEVVGDSETGLLHIVLDENGNKTGLLPMNGQGAIELVAKILQALSGHPDEEQRALLNALNPVSWEVEGSSRDLVVLGYELGIGLQMSLAIPRAQIEEVIQALQAASEAPPPQ
jgi:hypothetical protein